MVLLWPLIAMQNHLHSISTHILRAALLRFPAHCCSNSAMRNSDPGVRIVFVHGHDSDLNSIFAVQATGCNFQLVFRWIELFGCDASSSLGRVYSRQAAARNCEKSAVSFVMKYCPISTTFRNPASTQNLLNLSCCDNFSIRSPYCCNRRSLRARSSQSKGASVLITLGTQIGTIVYRQFSTAFAFELTSGQWTRGAEDWMFAFAKF